MKADEFGYSITLIGFSDEDILWALLWSLGRSTDENRSYSRLRKSMTTFHSQFAIDISQADWKIFSEFGLPRNWIIINRK